MMSSGMDLHFWQKRTWDAMKHLWMSWKSRISMDFMGPCGFKTKSLALASKSVLYPYQLHDHGCTTASGTTIMSLHRKLQKRHSFHVFQPQKNIQKHQLELSTLPSVKRPTINLFFQTFLVSTSPWPVFGPLDSLGMVIHRGLLASLCIFTPLSSLPLMLSRV